MNHRTTLTLILTLILTAPLAAEIVVLEAVRDTTLIEHPTGALSNGAGPGLFAGRTAQPDGLSVRRALVRFDLAALPEGARVERATLELYASRAPLGSRELSVHRLSGDWGEAGSFSGGGRGAPAQPGDATWLHSSYDTKAWKREGGDYKRAESARAAVSGEGRIRLSGERLAKDVERWLRSPHKNFGWLIAGDESASSSVVRIDSREHMLVDRRPRLELELRPPGRPGAPSSPSSPIR